jgi:hypothetical protein
MVSAYLHHEAHKADIAIDNCAPTTSSSQHITRSRKKIPTTDIDVNVSSALTTTHEFIIPRVMGYLNISGVLRFRSTCKSNHVAVMREVDQWRELVKESIILFVELPIKLPAM